MPISLYASGVCTPQQSKRSANPPSVLLAFIQGSILKQFNRSVQDLPLAYTVTCKLYFQMYQSQGEGDRCQGTPPSNYLSNGICQWQHSIHPSASLMTSHPLSNFISVQNSIHQLSLDIGLRFSLEDILWDTSAPSLPSICLYLFGYHCYCVCPLFRFHCWYLYITPDSS